MTTSQGQAADRPHLTGARSARPPDAAATPFLLRVGDDSSESVIGRAAVFTRDTDDEYPAHASSSCPHNAARMPLRDHTQRPCGPSPPGWADPIAPCTVGVRPDVFPVRHAPCQTVRKAFRRSDERV